MKKLILTPILLAAALFLSFKSEQALKSVEGLSLLDFTVVQNESKLNIEWSIAPASMGSYFTIEKSRDGVNFTKLIDMPATAIERGFANYFETDYQPFEGVSYYRIRETEEGGNIRLSWIVTTKYIDKIPVFSEEKDGTQIGQTLPEVLLILRDMEGNDLITSAKMEEIEGKIISILPTEKLFPGLYLVVGSSNEKLVRHQVLVK